MEVLGTGACGGVAKGRIFVYEKRVAPVGDVSVADIAEEVNRFQAAREISKRQLDTLYSQVVSEIGEDGASIFRAQKLLLDDPEFMGAVQGLIVDESVNSEYAVKFVGNRFHQMFSKIDDEYMRARAADVLDIENRLLSVLAGRPARRIRVSEPSIIVADDLSPSETVLLDKSKVLAFVTRYGSTNSHTTVLARNMNIPAIVGADFPSDCSGKVGIVDGDSGLFVVDPTELDILEYESRVQSDEADKEELENYRGLEDITLSGKKIALYANIGGLEDVALVKESDAKGIGLFRTEFLYLQAEELPNEEELFFTFQSIAEAMDGDRVIIRTMDIGADKQAKYFNLEPEANPALGYRGIRVSLDMPEVFKTELKAIYRASTFGNLAIMLPFITSVDEVRRTKELILEVKAELMAEGAHYEDIPLGVMIETPAAIMIAKELCEEVDFLSVGTNDLTQYVLVSDRQNPRLENVYDPKHPAVIRMLEMVCEAAHASGTKISICGELGSDITMTQRLIDMGFDQLSVNPSMVLKVRKAIRECK